MPIKSFRNQQTLDIYQGVNSKKSRRILPVQLHEKVRRMLDRIDKAQTAEEIASTLGYGLEILSGDREGQLSIRINKQYRICFYWSAGNAHAVEIVEYHG